VTTFRGPPLETEPGIGALTLGGLLAETAARHADREAVCFYADGTDEPPVRLTYAELEREARRVAKALVAAGATRGTRVAVLMANRPEWITAAFGTALAGAVDQIVAISKGPNRERKLSGWGRMRASEWDKVVELAEDFSGYTDLGDADPRFDLLLSRPEWTVAEWEAASRLSNESARQYLEGSSSVMRSNEKRGRANVYTTIKPPELS